jgi:hypothetical protein
MNHRSPFLDDAFGFKNGRVSLTAGFEMPFMQKEHVMALKRLFFMKKNSWQKVCVSSGSLENDTCLYVLLNRPHLFIKKWQTHHHETEKNPVSNPVPSNLVLARSKSVGHRLGLLFTVGQWKQLLSKANLLCSIDTYAPCRFLGSSPPV